MASSVDLLRCWRSLMVGIKATKWLATHPVTSRTAKTEPNSRFAPDGAERGLGSSPDDPSGEIMNAIPPRSRDQTRPQRLESYSRSDGDCNAFNSKFRSAVSSHWR